MRSSSPPAKKGRSSSWSWSYRIRRDSESDVPRPGFFSRSSSASRTSGSQQQEQQQLGEVTRNVLIRKSGPEVTTESSAKPRVSVQEKERRESVDRGWQQQEGGSRVTHQDGPQVQPMTGATKNNPNRRSMPHPPLSYYNRGRSAHQRAWSSSAAFQYNLAGHDSVCHLRPPAVQPTRSSSAEPSPIAVPTAAPSSFGRASLPPGSMPFAMHPPRDPEFATRTQRASARIQEVMNGHGSLQAPKAGPRLSAEYVPMAYADSSHSLGSDQSVSHQRPRALSNTSSCTLGSSMISARDSFESRTPSSSFASSRTSLDSSPSSASGYSPRSPRSPSYTHYQIQNNNQGKPYPWQRPAPIKTRRKAQPGQLFAALPGEVLENILEELRNLHFQPGSISCSTCWMRDCCSIAISARKFLKYAREALYQHVYLIGSESISMKKRTKVNHGSRLILLRRTLRSNQQIAVIVRSLKPPATPSSATTVEYNDLVASVVMACPNLERLVGFYPSYNHSFQRLFQALSTRPRLKEMTWVIEPSPSSYAHYRNKSSGGKKSSIQEGLYSYGPQGFLDFHWNWQQLTTLVVHGKTRAILGPNSVMEGTLRCLPSLQNLTLSHLPPTAFNDVNLLSLPPLKKLSLSYMPGVTTAGLSAMATRSASSSITTLTLIHINVESLPALARILSNLTSLETFNIVQAYAPSMPTDEFIWLFPYLASQTLRKLHWDIPYLPTRATTADNILAKSISANGFPSLRILRAPNDPEGVFQSLCRPEERADLPTDRFRTGQQAHLNGHGRTGSGYFPSRPSTSSGGGGGGAAPWLNNEPSSAPASPLFPPDSLMLPRDNSNLHISRLAAQARLETARRFPRFSLNIVDENDVVIEKYGIGAFLGSVESKIRYVLRPDTGGTDESGGLVTIPDLLGDCGEALVLEPSPPALQPQYGGYASQYDSERESSSGGRRSSISSARRKDRKKADADLEQRTREGCTGRWNTMSGNVIDKKDKERWWHAERGRWRGVALS
ncbi:hypothetical protein V8F33_006960 [Rhypophila sp. PSN 637]